MYRVLNGDRVNSTAATLNASCNKYCTFTQLRAPGGVDHRGRFSPTENSDLMATEEYNYLSKYEP